MTDFNKENLSSFLQQVIKDAQTLIKNFPNIEINNVNPDSTIATKDEPEEI